LDFSSNARTAVARAEMLNPENYLPTVENQTNIKQHNYFTEILPIFVSLITLHSYFISAKALSSML
jgi:hypothetical protein